MKLLREFVRGHPGQSLGMLLCLLLAGVLEGLGITSLLPLAALATSSDDGVLPAQLGSGPGRSIVDALYARGIAPSVELVLALIFVAFASRSFLLLYVRRRIGYTVAGLVRGLRLRLVRALLHARYGYYVRQRVGVFGNAFASEAQRGASAFVHLTWLVTHAVQFVVYVGIALGTSWRVTLIGSLAGLVVARALNALIIAGRRAGRRQTRLNKSLLATLTDVLQSVKPLKAMAREDTVAPLLEHGTLRLERAMNKDTTATESLQAFQDTIVVGILCVGFWLMRVKAGIEVAEVLLLTVLAERIFDVIKKAQRRWQKVGVDESAYWSLRATIDEAEAQRESIEGGTAPSLERGIELRELRLSYDERSVLDGVSLEIPAGGITALVGPSGAGKTTIVDLVAGLVHPDSGEVRIDGTPLASLDLVAWRRRIGYVPQETFLLHETIERNVSLGDPTIGRDRVEHALRRAHAMEFVAQLPLGIDTVAGERGTALSGGQRQRIAIARALLGDPWLLVLDEATTALDPASEAAVWEAVEELRAGGTTVLAISHQAALLSVADVIWRVEGGKAVRIEREDVSGSAR